jgi:hypothetical protein
MPGPSRLLLPKTKREHVLDPPIHPMAVTSPVARPADRPHIHRLPAFLAPPPFSQLPALALYKVLRLLCYS